MLNTKSPSMKAIETPILRIVSILPRLRTWLLKQSVFTSTVLPAIPRPIRWMLRRLYFLPLDVVDRLLGRVEEMVPPKSEIFAGSVDGFKRSGQTLVQRLIDFAGLEPASRILDVGCGMGRLAVPLTEYLHESGSYDGLDIVESGIRWCNTNIASKYPNFHFVLADVFNKEYHPKGHFKPSEYQFPYADETFDLVILISVFTHMLPDDMEHYVAEIGRVLKTGGRCFATYFLINDESRQLMQSGEASLRFKHDHGSHWLVNTKVPELSVGYDEQYARDVYERCGFSSEKTVYYGGWCGRPPFWSQASGLGDQDVVFTTKR
jgi:SAM-dependent methyltransferase